MSFDKSLTVRVNEPWLSRLGRMLNVVAQRRRRDRSAQIRQLLSKEAALWLDSPYVATRSEHLVVVSADGTVFYRTEQELDLKTARAKLPARFALKPERRRHYEELYAREPGRIRDHWYLHHVAAWTAGDVESEPEARHVDRLGLVVKTADLPINQPQETAILRETVVALSDYVDVRQEGDATEDRAGIPIDVPTLGLDVQIIVDLGLYDRDERQRSRAQVAYELRNAEDARFQRARVDSTDNPIVFIEDRFPNAQYEGSEYRPTLETVRASFERMKQRVDVLVNPDTRAPDGEPVVASDAARERLGELALPEAFLFGRFRWPMPYYGLHVCLCWPKPK